MSRVGRKLITLPKGVALNIGPSSPGKAAELSVKGPKGELKRAMPTGVTVKVTGQEAQVERADDSRENRAKHGMLRALLANMVKGVSDGFERQLEINGVGYRAEVAGQKLNMALGFSHPVVFDLRRASRPRWTRTSSSAGIDRELLGQTAAKIREIRPPEPYKGKGIKYVEEIIRRKVGKTGAA